MTLRTIPKPWLCGLHIGGNNICDLCYFICHIFPAGRKNITSDQCGQMRPGGCFEQWRAKRMALLLVSILKNCVSPLALFPFQILFASEIKVRGIFLSRGLSLNATFHWSNFFHQKHWEQTDQKILLDSPEMPELFAVRCRNRDSCHCFLFVDNRSGPWMAQEWDFADFARRSSKNTCVDSKHNCRHRVTCWQISVITLFFAEFALFIHIHIYTSGECPPDRWAPRTVAATSRHGTRLCEMISLVLHILQSKSKAFSCACCFGLFCFCAIQFSCSLLLKIWWGASFQKLHLPLSAKAKTGW